MTLVGEAPSWIEERSDPRAVPLPEGLAEMPPGPELGVLLAGIDRSSLSGDDLVTLLQAVARQLAYYQAELYAAMAEVAHCSSDLSSAERVEAIDEFASDEIGAALCFTRRAADMHLGLAFDLVERLPDVGDALRRGLIDLPRARMIVDGTCHLEESESRRVAATVLGEAPRLTTGQLGARVRRLAMSVQPEEAARRYEAAVEERRVMCLPNANGTADLVACNLPAERAAACMRTLDIAAHEAKRAGDPRSIDQLRTDILLDRLDVDRSTTKRRGVVDLHIDLTTLAGLNANPAEIPGFGPIIADVARRVAVSQHDSEWRVTVTNPDSGTVVWNGITRRRPTVSQRRYLEARHRSCVFPGCRIPAMDSDLDHTRDFAKGGATDVSNLGPLCRHHHRLKHEGTGGWSNSSPAYSIGPVVSDTSTRLVRDRREFAKRAGRPRGVASSPALPVGGPMETVAVLLNVGTDQVEAFESGFAEHELPVWEDLHGRGTLVAATLSRLDISSRKVEGAVQYLVVAIFATGEGHHEHDSHPGFQAWDKRADAFQVASPVAFGGETKIKIGL